ncbi:hypothetical protein RI367_005566 [Sorochytrium milnesiophthora]
MLQSHSATLLVVLACIVSANAILTVPAVKLTIDGGSDCQAAQDAASSDACGKTFQSAVQAADSDTFTKESTDKLIDTFSNGLTAFCSDSCMSAVKSEQSALRDKCHISSTDTTSSAGFATASFLWSRNFVCARSPSNGFCAAEYYNTLKPVLEQYPALMSLSMEQLLDTTSAATMSSNEMQAANQALLNLPNSVLCTPCTKFYVEQQAIFMTRQMAVQGKSSSDISAQLGNINNKCGSGFVSTDDSRFLLDQANPPSIKGASNGASSASRVPVAAMLVASAALVSSL